MKQVIGGDRLGSGKKMSVHMHGFSRANFNVSRDWRSSMAAGVLTPCFVDFMQAFDTYTIDMQSLIKTKPTIAPLYGAYKYQVDFFRIPVRLYNGILHNNRTGMGKRMNTILFPQMEVKKIVQGDAMSTRDTDPSSLLRYLGINNIGSVVTGKGKVGQDVTRKFNAIPLIAYYDIFKNYYANKQEGRGYVISAAQVDKNDANFSTAIGRHYQIMPKNDNAAEQESVNSIQQAINNEGLQNAYPTLYWQGEKTYTTGTGIYISTTKGWYLDLLITTKTDRDSTLKSVICWWSDKNNAATMHRETLDDMISNGRCEEIDSSDDKILLRFKPIGASPYYINKFYPQPTEYAENNDYTLVEFDLENIENMRDATLAANKPNSRVIINENSELPYKLNFSNINGERYTKGNEIPMGGLCVKTYQNDIFNNWLNKESVDALNGTGGMAVNVDVTNVNGQLKGALSLDALNTAKRIYNQLARIEVTGGTIDEWVSAVYGQSVKNRSEIPVYEGGMSSVIAFDEVVSSAETQSADGDTNALGSLAGRGFEMNQKGGRIKIWSDEPAFIIGIASITPYIDYSQGNKWFLTRLDNYDDIHKPTLDGIGYQNLMEEQAMGAAAYTQDGTTWKSDAIGKLPAWMDYQTAFNEVYGDFAEDGKAGYMVLKRDYTKGIVDGSRIGITDLTTYVDPSKFSNVFADVALQAQNFWVQNAFRVHKRSLMSAKQIPNL